MVRKGGPQMFRNSWGCVSSSSSSSSPRYSTHLAELVVGQYCSRPRITVSASAASFSTNCVTQYDSGWW